MAGEPKHPAGRLIPVHRAFLAALIFILGAGLPVSAQTESAQSGTTLEATVGLGGFTAAASPTPVRATISSPVLVAGRLRVRGGGVAVSRPIEVPAGGEQTYELTVPNLADGTRLTVEILDADGDVISSESVVLRSSFDELAVGVLGGDGLADTLGRVRTIITDRPVSPIVVPMDAPVSTFDVLGYLVVGRGGADRLDDALTWATGGGHLVVESSLAEAAGVADTPRPTGLDGVSATTTGSGRIVVVTDIESRTGEEWGEILRPTPLDLGNSPEWGMWDQGGGLFQAATESGSRQVPSLPWLGFAIVGFAAVVGPVNFIVLSKLKKRDWAWLTIPVLSLIAVTGFWIAGRQRIAGTNLTHASVIVSDGTVQARSALIVAAGTAGERRVSFDPAASVFPERNFNMSTATAELRIEGDGSAVLDLEQLGYAGVGLLGDTDLVLPTVTVSDGRVTVDNGSGFNFWGWGAVRGASAVVAADDLNAGMSGDVAVPVANNQFGFGFIDALMNQRQLWEDPERSNSLWTLGQVLSASTDDSGTYFVGLTDDYAPEVSVTGSSGEVPGPTIVVVRVDTGDPGPGGGGETRAAASVVGTGFINWLDWGVQHVVSTDQLTVSFSLPASAGSVRFDDTMQFGMPAEEYQAWDWGAGEFVAIERGANLPGATISGDGQVFVRLVGQEFGENPFSPDSLVLEWDA